MIHWGNLTGIWLLLPILICYLLILRVGKLRFNLVRTLSNNCLKEFTRYSFKLKIKLILWFFILLALLVAFLAPQWGQYEQLVPQAGRNVVIALDISKSMLAEDFKPNRLMFAKNKIKKLVQNLAGERVGLIVFASDAVVMCPLTRDRDLLLTFLEDTTVQTISSGMTNLTSAIVAASKMVQSANDGSTNLLTIFTDGEDFSGGLQAAGQLAKEAGIQIFTVGVATVNGAPIPNLDLQSAQSNGFLKDKHGKVVISKLNQAVLQEVAQACGGKSMEAQLQSDRDIEQILDWVANFEKHKLSEKSLTLQAEKYYYFASVAFILLLIEWLL